MLVRRDMKILHLRRPDAADRLCDQSPIGALEGCVSFNDQLRHAAEDRILSERSERQGTRFLV